jgi:ribosomal protein S21
VPTLLHDVFLLCSDGLTDMLSNEKILDLVEDNREDIDVAIRALVKAANKQGGEDNITVVAFEIADVGAHDGDTQEQAVPAELIVRRKVEDEETLDETDGVPVIEVPDEERDEEEEATRRRHRRRRMLAWLALLLFLGAIAALVVWRLLT